MKLARAYLSLDAPKTIVGHSGGILVGICYKQQLDSIIKALEGITGNISYDAKDIYQLNYRIKK